MEHDASQQLVAVGFLVSGAAIRNPSAGGDTTVTLDLPSQASATPFTELELDWNAMGHPPPGVYDKPHFDFHFYTISDALRQTIQGSPATPDPGALFRPSGFSPPAATVPMMGGHSYDKTGPEFNGGCVFQDPDFRFLQQDDRLRGAGGHPGLPGRVGRGE